METVRIVATPAGEAPEWVRKAWVGLDLPCKSAKSAMFVTLGVTAPAPTFWAKLGMSLGFGGERQKGFAVPAIAAVEALAAVNPEAAAWWRENTPQLLRPGQALLFDEAACKMADEPSP